MVEWVQTIAKEAKVSLELAAPAAAAKPGVSVYLMEVLRAPTMRQVREPEPLKLTLRYLVTTWASSPEESHRLLGQLMFAAMAAPQKEVEEEAVPHSLWSSFGQPVRPSFVVRVPLFQARPVKREPKVKQLIINQTLLRPLRGQILGPDDQAIMDALVEVLIEVPKVKNPVVNASTHTDEEGRFYFAGVPPVKSLRVHGKGGQTDVPAEPRTASAEPLVIHLNESQI